MSEPRAEEKKDADAGASTAAVEAAGSASTGETKPEDGADAATISSPSDEAASGQGEAAVGEDGSVAGESEATASEGQTAGSEVQDTAEGSDAKVGGGDAKENVGDTAAGDAVNTRGQGESAEGDNTKLGETSDAPPGNAKEEQNGAPADGDCKGADGQGSDSPARSSSTTRGGEGDPTGTANGVGDGRASDEAGPPQNDAPDSKEASSPGGTAAKPLRRPSIPEQFEILSRRVISNLSRVKENSACFDGKPEAQAFWHGLAGQTALMQKLALVFQLHLTKAKQEHSKTRTKLQSARAELLNLQQQLRGQQDTAQPTLRVSVAADGAVNTSTDGKQAYTATTVAGSVQGFDDGKCTSAMFNYPCSVYYDRKTGDLYVADKDNCAVRQVDSSGVVTTVLSSSNASLTAQLPSAGEGGSAPPSICPRGVGRGPGGYTYVADLAHHRIWRLGPDGKVESFAGGSAGYRDGKGADAQFNCPCSLAVDPSTGTVYVTDLKNNCIRRVGLDGSVTTLAGQPEMGYVDGVGSAARFNFPCGIALHPDGSLCVADSDNNAIRRVTLEGDVSTMSGGKLGGRDGPKGEAEFNGPCGLDIDKLGNVYVADAENFKVRKISAAGAVTTVATGGGGSGSSPTVAGASASFFDCPCDVAVDDDLCVYVADWWNHRIRKLTPIDGKAVAATPDAEAVPPAEAKRATARLGTERGDARAAAVAGRAADEKKSALLDASLIRNTVSPSDWILSTAKINLPGARCAALVLESVTLPLLDMEDPHIVVTVVNRRGMICGKSVRTTNLAEGVQTKARGRRRSSLFKLPTKLRIVSRKAQDLTNLSKTVYVCPPPGGEASGDAPEKIDNDEYKVFFELKHWKESKQKFSTRCFTYMDFKEGVMLSSDTYRLPLYSKPTDFTRKKISRLRGAHFLQLEVLPYHSQLR